MGIPRERARESLGFEVIFQRSQAPPTGISARQFDHAAHEYKTEQQPAVQPNHDAQAEGQKKSQKTAFQQKHIPLKAQEVLTA